MHDPPLSVLSKPAGVGDLDPVSSCSLLRSPSLPSSCLLNVTSSSWTWNTHISQLWSKVWMTTEVNKLTQKYQPMQLLITIREISTWHIQNKSFLESEKLLYFKILYFTTFWVFNIFSIFSIFHCCISKIKFLLIVQAWRVIGLSHKYQNL